MATESEIKAKHLKDHDDLSSLYYEAGTINKEAFDIQHAQVWKDCNQELINEGFITVPDSPRNLEAEIDALTDKQVDLEIRIAKLEEMT